MVSFICGFEPAGGNIMIIILTILFYTGLSLNSSTHVQNGILPPPILWAEPGSMISWGKSVTILCQGILEAQEYYLNKKGMTKPIYRQTVLEPGSKVKFFISSTTELHAGQYHCYYESTACFSEHSDMLELVVTENIATTNSSLNISDPQTGSSLKGHTVENLTRITMAVLILVALGILLFEAQHSQRKKDTGHLRVVKK
ncbi:leukocyte immunoglobulin-like receptor subfamily A member 1 isoform X2 [Grammomys surdaster]|uniref:leukocyte immunoglobulin-like receptor subfamily A member 1 isoform X2 n=1 Tax=Grammomys surdaster TaxID=491861 RepID=UPI0010A04F6E|nr:leukocyte immunoglobulin-like receptor subfamily A member 1 isoform X2 [Grammomys surdaster]